MTAVPSFKDRSLAPKPHRNAGAVRMKRMRERRQRGFRCYLLEVSEADIDALPGDIVAMRVENWKIVFLEQRAPGTLAVWGEPFTPLRLPKMYDLHADPYEQADITSNTYYGWELEQGYVLLAGSTLTGEFLKTFKDFPPSQRPATFTIDQAMEKLKQNLGSQ